MVVGIQFINGKPHLVYDRFVSVDVKPASIEDLKSAINELSALTVQLIELLESNSIVEQDELIEKYLASKASSI